MLQNTTLNPEGLIAVLTQLRTKKPLVHNITNYVVMNNSINALLALGASPIVAYAHEELDDIISISSSLVLNIGTLNPQWVSSMEAAGRIARHKGIPCVFDPVGAGASKYRTTVCKLLMEECKPAIIRGNASEIMALIDADVQTKGVDSTQASSQAVEAAKQLARQHSCVVAVSGEIDYITDGSEVIEIHNGSTMMPLVTGMGCTATAVVGAFAACHPNMFEAAAYGMVVMGIAGEMAAEQSEGPASLQLHFIDRLYQLSDSDIRSRLRSK